VAANGWTTAGVVIASLSLLAVVIILGAWTLNIGTRSLKATTASLEATKEATRVTKEAAEATATAALLTQQVADAARRDAHRQRLEHILDMIERMEVLARRRYMIEPGTQQHISSDDSAEPELLAALVSLRAYLDPLPDELPNVRQLSLEGGREADAHRIQGRYLGAVTDVRNALVGLATPPQETE
jgi:hypothetical protein